MHTHYGGDTMGLDEFPTRGSSGIYDDDGSSRVPKSIRNKEDWGKGTDLEWVSDNEEEFVRVYEDSDIESRDED